MHPISSRRKATSSRLRKRLSHETLERRDLMTTTTFYDDALQAPWQNWSWGVEASFENAAPVADGGRSVSAQYTDAWAGLYFGSNEGVSARDADEIRFSIHGGDGGHEVRFVVVDGNGDWLAGPTIDPPANTWTDVTVDLVELGSPNHISGIVWQEFSGTPSTGKVYIDNVQMIDDGPGQPNEPELGPSITVDASITIREISDDIYGLNFADPDLAAEIDLPVNRWGGNSTSRYNYQIDATNLASDWYFQNYPSETPDVSTLPANSTADVFVREGGQVGADSIMTVGMMGWVPTSREIQGSFPVDQFGPQQSVDPWRNNIGNGIRPDGSPITGNDPNAISDPVDEDFAKDWVRHLVQQHGTAANGGVAYYALDNEPMLWSSTHRDVHPEPASYDEVLDKGVTYATAIKEVDPTAQVLGPTSWGWTAYHYSALDAAAGGAWWANPQDRNAHGGMSFVPWYLQEMAAAESSGGDRLLDYLDIHYYPQNEGVALAGAGSLATQQARLRSTRSLWDPTYVDESWINEEVRLIPLMREWIDTYYPGTKLAITEYNWGGVDHISGAVTQADVLGIFGREGVDLATMWSPPQSDDPTAYSFRMYRNYDGQGTDGSSFGETSVFAGTTNSEEVSVFASRRDSDDALTIMLVNKSTEPLTTPIELGSAVGSVAAEMYTYDDSSLDQIVRGSDVAFTDGSASLVLPGYSITLLEVPGVAAESPSVTGDFDGDQEVTVADIDRLSLAIRSGSTDASYDLTGDGVVNRVDHERMIRDVVRTVYGDANLDRRVDALDLNAVGGNWLNEGTGWATGDFNGDGVTKQEDLNDLGLNWQSGQSVVGSRLPRAALAFVRNDADDTATDERAIDDLFERLGLALSGGEVGPEYVSPALESTAPARRWALVRRAGTA